MYVPLELGRVLSSVNIFCVEQRVKLEIDAGGPYNFNLKIFTE